MPDWMVGILALGAIVLVGLGWDYLRTEVRRRADEARESRRP